MMGKRGVRDMISKKKIAATTFGALALATVFALTAARVASHSASAEPWFVTRQKKQQRPSTED
jgi:hypothetical protein